MTGAAVNSERTRAVTTDDNVARARERFLSQSTDDNFNVRRIILASWQRSRENDIDVDRINVPYLHDRDSTTPLLRSATPILDTLHQQLQDEPVSIILTDQAGVVLDRRTTSRELTERLDFVSLAPGYSYAEEFAGTNGIGTAISSGQQALVDGREHYTHQLGQFACAGAPIHHPTRRTVIGILDLTSWAHAPGPMLMALASATARQIEDELLAQTGLREFALFQEYLKACQQSGGPVLAINNDVVMMNEHVRVIFDAPEQQALLAYAADMLRSDDRTVTRTVELPSARTANVKCAPVACEAGRAGTVFRVRLVQEGRRAAPGALIRGIRSSLTPPGVVGSSPVWTRCVQQVNSCYEAGEWLALAGEPGTGKQTLLRAVHQLHNPTRSFRSLEPPEPSHVDAWLAALDDAVSTPGGMVLLEHADQLDEQTAQLVADLLLELGSEDDEPTERGRVAITVTSTDLAANALVIAFARTIEVPPLRHHVDDLNDLVPFLLSQLIGDDRLTVSSRAMAQLRRLNWPGNVTQLRRLLSEIVKRRHSGVIEIADLPPEARTAGHRVLTPIEALERDAIVQALLDNAQRPAAAARALGMSRATIYRKFHHYGISLPLAH
jgi:sigma-54 dependent transcriptional regulator, acetoin dehydrogenase operon transcriptional activator AcoR